MQGAGHRLGRAAAGGVTGEWHETLMGRRGACGSIRSWQQAERQVDEAFHSRASGAHPVYANRG